MDRETLKAIEAEPSAHEPMRGRRLVRRLLWPTFVLANLTAGVLTVASVAQDLNQQRHQHNADTLVAEADQAAEV